MEHRSKDGHRRWDVIVIGGGHAGCEAAAASARMGAHTALVTMSIDNLGAMSCNPAIGGLGKGHLVREVDAWDGLMARAADDAAIHYRMLNQSKGAAVQGPRIQADRRRYKSAITRLLQQQPNLEIVEANIEALSISTGRVTGVITTDGEEFFAHSVVLATGTFLNAELHWGLSRVPGGRVGEAAATTLARQLRGELNLPIAKLKTGTPPRLDGRTIDWSALEIQHSDRGSWTFSPLTSRRKLPQVFCAITRTNDETHRIIRNGLDRSPLFSGAIEGRGPRYCPSIEDKVVRFGDRDGHQIFLEPEGLDDITVYPNGISTSLPSDVQAEMVRSIAGLERVDIVQSGYAVEYDYVDPRILEPSLSVRSVPGLYCAGQINGTTGYEEAAAQGLVAGLNAAASALDRPEILFDRTDSYIGVMVDDLTLQGVSEPYRMLTARAEYRLRLRADNATTRLTGKAIAARAVSSERHEFYRSREDQRERAKIMLDRQLSASDIRGGCGVEVASDAGKKSLFNWLRFPEIGRAELDLLQPDLASIDGSIVDELVGDGRYAPYVDRQAAEIARLKADDAIALDGILDYAGIGGLSNEMVERLNQTRPPTLGSAARIRGITPAALAAIHVHIHRRAA